MNLNDSRKKVQDSVETLVYCHMNKNDIEQACRDYGIKGKDRADMEQKLINAMIEKIEKKLP